jgi:hypothetical protein
MHTGQQDRLAHPYDLTFDYQKALVKCRFQRQPINISSLIRVCQPLVTKKSRILARSHDLRPMSWTPPRLNRRVRRGMRMIIDPYAPRNPRSLQQLPHSRRGARRPRTQTERPHRTPINASAKAPHYGRAINSQRPGCHSPKVSGKSPGRHASRIARFAAAIIASSGSPLHAQAAAPRPLWSGRQRASGSRGSHPSSRAPRRAEPVGLRAACRMARLRALRLPCAGPGRESHLADFSWCAPARRPDRCASTP